MEQEGLLQNIHVLNLIQDHYALVVLFVDDRKELEPEAKKRYSELYNEPIRNIGGLNSIYQETQFQSRFQPYFVILNTQGKVVDEKGYSRDRDEFLAFLKKGIE